MINLVSAGQPSERLRYICQIIFERILRCNYRLITPAEAEDIPDSEGEAFVYYGLSPHGLGISVPDSGLLRETGIRNELPKAFRDPYLKFHFGNEAEGGYTFSYDIFSCAFYLITEYYNYVKPVFDRHGRYDEKANFLFTENHHSEPLVQLYAEALWAVLQRNYPNLPREKNSFEYTITFDIDSPWLFRHKSLWLKAAGLGADLVRFRPELMMKRLKTLLGGADDPYENYPLMLRMAKPERLMFFFLIDRHSSHDDRFTFRNTAYRNLIRKISEFGAGVGIHPSYTSFDKPERIAFETERLSEIIERPVRHSRMHFLRYRLPDTYRALIQAGIHHDYTSCPVHSPGFRNFIALPFPWFDLAANHVTRLMLHPTAVMDRTLQQYMGLEPPDAARALNKVIEITRRYNGHFVLLLHNNTLSDWQEWKGWRPVFGAAEV